MDIESGLENRIIESGYKSNNITKIIDNIITKRYPRTRIQRLMIHLLNQLDGPIFKELYENYPSYIRVLGANSKGLILLNRIKENSSLPIITKFADHRKYQDDFLAKTLQFDKKSTDIFFLGIDNPRALSNMDYYISPYIK